jgi:hypothetical protein
MAKKATAKPAAKRKPRAKKPVQPAIELSEKDIVKSVAWRSWVSSGLKAVALIVAGAVAGVWGAGGIDIGPGPIVRNDVLQQSYDADRITQIAVLRDLAKQPFDGSTADGKIAAQDWFNVQRFRNRPTDYVPYTEAVAEAIDANSEEALAATLEGK